MKIDKEELRKQIIKELTKEADSKLMEIKAQRYIRRVILWERIKRIFYVRC